MNLSELFSLVKNAFEWMQKNAENVLGACPSNSKYVTVQEISDKEFIVFFNCKQTASIVLLYDFGYVHGYEADFDYIKVRMTREGIRLMMYDGEKMVNSLLLYYSPNISININPFYTYFYKIGFDLNYNNAKISIFLIRYIKR